MQVVLVQCSPHLLRDMGWVEKDAYLGAKSSFLVKVALHEITIFPGRDLTPEEQ